MPERMTDEELEEYERCAARSEPPGDRQWVQIVPALLAEIKALKHERDELSDELSACKESPGGCGYWREAARHREQERDEARQALARFQSEKPELGDLSFREQLRSQMIKEYLDSAPTARIEVNDQERPAPPNLLENAS